MYGGLNANKNLLFWFLVASARYVSVVGLWENKAGYYDLNSQGRETCHMKPKETFSLFDVVSHENATGICWTRPGAVVGASSPPFT